MWYNPMSFFTQQPFPNHQPTTNPWNIAGDWAEMRVLQWFHGECPHQVCQGGEGCVDFPGTASELLDVVALAAQDMV
jgi:hypothetical protein